MKGATHCAKKLRQVLRKLKLGADKSPPPAPGDPIEQLILGIFSRDVPESRARDALERLRANVVDYNELRVVPPIELANIVGKQPNVRLKCEDLSRALNRIFAREHTVSLDHVARLAKREMIAYLDDLDGLEAYTRARIRLLGFGKHAVPLDEAMWAYARQVEIVSPDAPLDEAQAFLERQVAEKVSYEFVVAVRKHAWAECGPAVRKGAVERIASVPPDRTTRNMLQMVAGETPDSPAADDADDLPGESTEFADARGDGSPATAKPAASARRRSVKQAATRKRKDRAGGRSRSAGSA